MASTATTATLCGPTARLLKDAGLLQLENGLLSRLHWKPAIGLVPAVAENVILIELEVVVPPFCIIAPLPSTAEVMVVSGGIGEIVIVEITETVVSIKLATYMLPLVESKAIPPGP
ncbi:MAG: hypothetical protein DLM72_05390 [Candidatus Nitrosopolaris wilkensis]|nr:MAG: hypothetical protein DLM72_05390 [Candidatus Nitrosopolaris wilkensis]